MRENTTPMKLTLETLSCKTVEAAIREAKDETRRQCDFVELWGQAVSLDEDMQRCTSDESADFYFDGVPTMRDIKKAFADHPEAVMVELQFDGCHFNDPKLSVGELYEDWNIDKCGHTAVVEIWR